MSTNIVPFNFHDHQVRVVTIDSEPWFVLTDLCKVLDISNVGNTAARLDDDVKGVHSADTLGGRQSMTIVSEAGMYEVVLLSRKPEARAFKKWITGTVLPEIRKTGSYGVQRELTEQEIVHQALQITARQVKELEAKVEEDAPKVAYVDRFVGQVSDAITVDVFASQFGSTGPKVRELMREKNVAVRKFLGERWSPTKQQMEKEYEWRPRQGVASADWFDLRPQHNAPRLHNGQVRQTMYVRQFHAADLAARLGLEPVAS